MDSRVIQRFGQIDPHSAHALAGLFGLPPEGVGPHLPPMWHWVYLLDAWQREDLGPDGHSRNGMPAPPPGSHTRMFAGGRTSHLHPLDFGVPAEKSSRVIRSVDKQGRSGPLTFVTVKHEYSQAGRTAIIEEQDIVYKPASISRVGADAATQLTEPSPGIRKHAANAEARPLLFAVDNVALFLFSALTYNPHRIHYDRAYAASEGHPDLVVHGPLQIILMAEALRSREIPTLGAEFSYRLLAPVTGPQTLTVEVETAVLASTEDAAGDDAVATVQVHDGAGRVTAQGILRTPSTNTPRSDTSDNPAAPTAAP